MVLSWCFPVLRCFGCVLPIKADSVCMGKIFISVLRAGISEKIILFVDVVSVFIVSS